MKKMAVSFLIFLEINYHVDSKFFKIGIQGEGAEILKAKLHANIKANIIANIIKNSNLTNINLFQISSKLVRQKFNMVLF